MNNDKVNYFREKLLMEREDVYSLLKQMEANEVFNSKVEMSTELSELSMYDNHPSDIATEVFYEETGRALKENELTIIKKINESLHNIEEGTYGVCKNCGKEIPEERLEFIPYTEFCVKCQDAANDMRPREKNNRPLEEDILLHDDKFGLAFNDFDDTENEVGFDAEDSYQAVQRWDWRKNVDYEIMDEDPGYVEPIELVSNEQYRNQLPD